MPLLSIYNHLMQGYAMMRPSRFDTHKKSELKDVYRNIMRLTAEQPLYRISFDEPAQTYTLGIKNSALSLSSIVKELNIDDGTSVFEKRTLASSDTSLVDVSELTGSDVSDDSLPMEVEVLSLSSPQENAGTFVSEQDAELPKGQYNFRIDVDENVYSFQFNVTEGSSNLDLQKKLADFINKTSIGLRTRIVRETSTGRSRLDILSQQPGSNTSGEASFVPQDVRYPAEAPHGIITHFGLDQVAKPPVNTVFTLNGEVLETRGHSYITADGISLTFHAVTKDTVTVSKVTDEAPIADKIKSFVDCYNSLLDTAKNYQSVNHRAKKLCYDLSNTLRHSAEEMEACGLSPDREGKLMMDREAVCQAAKDGSLERLFSAGRTLSYSLLRKLSDISLNPMEYLDKTVVTYPNTAARKTFSPYVSSIYSGLLYNNYC